MQKFPFRAPQLQRFVDPEQKLSSSERRRLGRAINALEKRFPRLKIYTCLVRLPGGVDSREFAFWLYNRSTPANEREAEERTNGIMLLIDRNKRSASLTVGYALDPFLDDSWLQSILEPIKSELRESNYAEAMCALFQDMRKSLVPLVIKATSVAERSGYHRRKPQVQVPADFEENTGQPREEPGAPARSAAFPVLFSSSSPVSQSSSPHSPASLPSAPSAPSPPSAPSFRQQPSLPSNPFTSSGPAQPSVFFPPAPPSTRPSAEAHRTSTDRNLTNYPRAFP